MFIKLIRQIKSKETWERVIYFAKLKNPKEGFKPLTKNDILPLSINIILGIILIVIIYSIIEYFSGK